MAHFAQIDKNNMVTQVLVVDNENLIVDGVESEQVGIDFLASLGLGSNWIQTSYNNKFRYHFAGIGDIYDKERDIFVKPERPDNEIEVPWFGLKQPTSPSIMIDAAPRSGNRWLNATVNCAFPSAFQRWGYLHQHNVKTFENSIGKFDIIISVIRNPQDSLASTLNIFGHNDSQMIINNIIGTMDMLKGIKQYKNDILLFTFEEITQNISAVLNVIASQIQVNALPIDEAEIKDRLIKESSGSFYSLPIDNAERLDEMKAILARPEFESLMKEATNLYNQITDDFRSALAL